MWIHDNTWILLVKLEFGKFRITENYRSCIAFSQNVMMSDIQNLGHPTINIYSIFMVILGPESGCLSYLTTSHSNSHQIHFPILRQIRFAFEATNGRNYAPRPRKSRSNRPNKYQDITTNGQSSCHRQRYWLIWESSTSILHSSVVFSFSAIDHLFTRFSKTD
jgi:hypothetical protein